MKLTFRIYLAVLASLLLFMLSILLLGVFLGGHDKRAYTQKVANIFQTDVLPKLDLSLSTSPLVEKLIAERHQHDESIRKNQLFVDGEMSTSLDKKTIKKMRRVWRHNHKTLRIFTKEHHASIIILLPNGHPVYRVGRPPRSTPFFKHFADKTTVEVTLSHGLKAYIRTHNPNISIDNFVMRFLIGLGILFLCVGLISYPIARRISKRLEKLTTSVNQWGQSGSTSLLLPNKLIVGNDEIATLSQSFSNASQRIDDLLKANKLLLANASHEIRTPLTRIRLNIEMLENVIDTSKLDDYKKRESAIKRNLNELDELVESILQSSRLDAQDSLVNAMTIDLYNLVRREAEHFPELAVTGEAAEVVGQENLLTQLVRNLISNAYKHGKPPVSASVMIEHNTVIFTVTDAGGDIPEEKIDEIFTPFKRLSNNTKGNGLGLHLVKKIVDLHDGIIAVKSNAGETRFCVSLNAKKEQLTSE